jgi:hypothetical protein
MNFGDKLRLGAGYWMCQTWALRKQAPPRGPIGYRSFVDHPLIEAITPFTEAVGAKLLAPQEAEAGDIPLVWEGQLVAAVRLPDLHGALDRLVAGVETELGGRLVMLTREDKQTAVCVLEERGAFTLRKGVEQVAELLGVSRFTVYAYLNASRELQAGQER